MTVTVKHSKTNAISDWTQAQLDEQIALGNFAPGTTLANIVLPSDWNNDHTLTGIGTMAEQNANNVAITGGTINNASIGATTASTGKFTSVTTPSVTASSTDLTLSAISTGAVKFNTLGGLQSQVINSGDGTRTLNIYGGNSAGTLLPTLFSTVGSMQIAAGASASVRFQTNATSNTDGIEQFRITHTNSAVNYVQVTGAATTVAPVISVQGSDSNIAFSFVSKGTARHNFFNNGATSSRQFAIGTSGITSAVNFLNVDGSVSGIALPMQAQGSDSNISMAFQPKGTGAIDLAAGSSGVNISNGGTVTAITRTASGGSYTSVPSVTISPPTTAGGVQATASAAVFIQTVTIAGGGTGYTVNDTLTVVGGTSVVPATLTVTSVSAGVITGVSVATGGTSYTVLPTNPFSVTGGTGSGATFNATQWGVSATITITNAGSGYIEQPTVSFSGGGGSGASAYATVGGNTIIRTLGSTSVSSGLSFYTPAGEQVRITDPGATTVNYITMWGGVTGGATRLLARGSDTDVSMMMSAKGAGSIIFRTNDTNQTQMQVTHTASAVNYVQVTGSSTGNGPAVSAQGSDTNIALQLISKNVAAISMVTNAAKQFDIYGNANSVNFIRASGNTAGNAPSLNSNGSDTNIDLTLVPKGTGLVRFGTYTAGAPTATGYISIKAADGTTYKVLVST